jgi:integrase
VRSCLLIANGNRARGAEMSVKIGIRDILTMQPNSILWDATVKGFNARRQKSEAITFSVFYRSHDQIQRWHRIGRFGVWTPDQARREAQRVLRAREDPSGARMSVRNSPTVQELLDEYVAEMDAHRINAKKASTIITDKGRIKNYIAPRLGKLKVASVTQNDLEEFMHELSPGSAKRIIGLTGAIFSYAIKKKLRETNPVRGIEKPKDRHKLRRLSVVEYQQLWSALEKEKTITSEIFLFLAVSGWRSGEARLLKYAELDLDRRIASLSDTKSGQSFRPLSVAAIEIIQRQPSNGEYVFALRRNGKPVSNLPLYWKRLGLDKTVTAHSMRHSLASLAADMLIPDHLISGLLGHARHSITSRYTHLSDRALIDTADRVAEATLKLMRA